ncbi:hypothetical protein GW17_00030238 [Ensete ventricosum]|nr:hypothetical protein GW17_00030238 [Ensete ventricosum]RZR87915.1 hypothetical protein BHM03_00015390 [Ensete ventricosum]
MEGASHVFPVRRTELFGARVVLLSILASVRILGIGSGGSAEPILSTLGFPKIAFFCEEIWGDREIGGGEAVEHPGLQCYLWEIWRNCR